MKVKQITKLKEIKYKASGAEAYVCRALLDPAPKRPYMEIMFVWLNDSGIVQTLGFPLADKVNLERIKRQVEFTDNPSIEMMVDM